MINMTKKERLERAKNIATLLIKTLKEIKITEEDELNALFLALGVSNVEQIDDAKIYCLACDQEQRGYNLKNIIEEFESGARDLFNIKL